MCFSLLQIANTAFLYISNVSRKIAHWKLLLSYAHCNLQPNWRPGALWLDSWTLGSCQSINCCQSFVCTCVYMCVHPVVGQGRQQCAALESKTPLGLEEPQGPFSSQPFFFFFPKVHAQTLLLLGGSQRKHMSCLNTARRKTGPHRCQGNTSYIHM